MTRQELARLAIGFAMFSMASAAAVREQSDETAVATTDQSSSLTMSNAAYAAASAWLFELMSQNIDLGNLNIVESVNNFLGRWTRGEVSVDQGLIPLQSSQKLTFQKTDPITVSCGGDDLTCQFREVVRNGSTDVELVLSNRNDTISSQILNEFTTSNQLVRGLTSFQVGNDTMVAAAYNSNLADVSLGGTNFAAGFSLLRVTPTGFERVPIVIDGVDQNEIFANVIFPRAAGQSADVVGDQTWAAGNASIRPGVDQDGNEVIDLVWESDNQGAIKVGRLFFRDGKYVLQNAISKTTSVTSSVTRSISATVSATASLILASFSRTTTVSSTPSLSLSPSPSPIVSLSPFAQVLPINGTGRQYFNRAGEVFVSQDGNELRVNGEIQGLQALSDAQNIKAGFDVATFTSDGKLLMSLVRPDQPTLALGGTVDLQVENCDQYCRSAIVKDPNDPTGEKFFVEILRNGIEDSVKKFRIDGNQIIEDLSPSPSPALPSPSPFPQFVPLNFNGAVINVTFANFTIDATKTLESVLLEKINVAQNATKMPDAKLVDDAFFVAYDQASNRFGIALGNTVAGFNASTLDRIKYFNGSAFDAVNLEEIFGQDLYSDKVSITNLFDDGRFNIAVVDNDGEKIEKTFKVENGTFFLDKFEPTPDKPNADKKGKDANFGLYAGAAGAGAAVFGAIAAYCCIKKRCCSESKTGSAVAPAPARVTARVTLSHGDGR